MAIISSAEYKTWSISGLYTVNNKYVDVNRELINIIEIEYLRKFNQQYIV